MATTPRPIRPQTEDEILDDVSEISQLEPLIEGLTPELEKCLIELVADFERESYVVWRQLYRNFLEAESFWKDLQQGFYDYEQDIWRVPTIEQLQQVGEAGESVQFATNIYRAFGWTLISVLGQKLPTTTFLPQDYQEMRDVIAAEAARKTVPLIRRANRTNLLNMRASYLLYTHGICASYTRHLVDGDRFGYRKEPVIELQSTTLQEEGAECLACGAFTPGSQAFDGVCPECQAPFSMASYRPAEKVDMPIISGYRDVPKGRELITIHGGLELRLPPWPNELPDCPYLGLVMEIHLSQLKQTYGKRAEKLQGGLGSGPYDTWDRTARLALIEPNVGYYSQANNNLVTLKRYWLRRAALYMVSDVEKRKKLLELFPHGAYIAFADPANLLDARDESMDDHWEVCRALEGAGMYTPALGQSAISIQKRFNTVMDFIMEWIEYAAAGQGTFVNAAYVNHQALSKQRRAPGNIYPIWMTGNQPLANVIYESRPGAIAGEVFNFGNGLQSLGQQVTGAVPTVSGGTEMSLRPTTYLADREQALGRLFVPWSYLRVFWAQTDLKAVKQFAKHRTDDEKFATLGVHGELEGYTIALEELDGNFDAYPETNENFPQLWHQMQAVFMKLMESQDDQIRGIIGHPNNLPFGKAMLGLPDLYVPGEDDRRKQQKEIQALLEQQPAQVLAPSPMGGDPQEIIIPSIMPDEFEDDHLAHMETVREWAVSPAGSKAKAESPQGYMNVVAHGKLHKVILDQRLAQEALAQGAPAFAGGKEKPAKGEPVEAGAKTARETAERSAQQ